MQTISDIMATELKTLNASSSLMEAKQLMHDFNIRNLPIIDDEGKWVGMLTQKEYLKHAFYLVSTFGTKLLSKKESDTSVGSIMNTDMMALEITASLIEAADIFIDQKHTCIPIVDKQRLAGLLTPIDFVKMARDLIKDE